MQTIKMRECQLLTVRQWSKFFYRGVQTTAEGSNGERPPFSKRVSGVSQEGTGGAKSKFSGSNKPGERSKSFKRKEGDARPKPLNQGKPGEQVKLFKRKEGGVQSKLVKPLLKSAGSAGVVERVQHCSGVLAGKQVRPTPTQGFMLPPQRPRRDPLVGQSGVMPSSDPEFDLPMWVWEGNYQPYLPTVEDEAKTWLLTVPPLEPTAFCRGASAVAEVEHRGQVLTRGHWSSIKGLRQRGSKLFPRFAARLRRYRVRTWWGGQWAHRATTYFTAGYWRATSRLMGYRTVGFSAPRHSLVWRRRQFFAQRVDGENFRWQPNYRKKRQSQLTYKFLLHNGFYRRRASPQWHDLLEEPLTLTMHRMVPQSLPDFTQSLFWNRKYFQKVLYRIKSYGRLRQYFWWDRSAHRLNHHLQSFVNRFESQLFIILRRMRLAPSYAVAYFLIRKGFVTVDGVTIYDVKFRLFRGAFIQLSMYRLRRFLAAHHDESFGEKERIEEEERGNRPHFGNRLGLYYENLAWSVKRYHYQHLHVDYRSLSGVYLHDASLAFSKYYRLHRTFKEYRRLFSLLFANGKYLI